MTNRCKCGKIIEGGKTACADCRKRESQEELDRALKEQYDPKHTQPLFGGDAST